MTSKESSAHRTIAFAHNGPLYRSSDGGLYGTHITDALRQRYLQLGSHVHFLMRERRLPDLTDAYSKLLNESMSFTPVPEVLSPRALLANQRTAKSRIDQVIRSSDILVARIPSLIGRWAIAAAERHRTPYMIECVACNWDALSNHNSLACLSAPWYWFMQRRIVARAPFVIYVTDHFLQGRYPTRGRSFSISNVELPDYAPPTTSTVHFRSYSGTRNARSVTHLVTVACVSTPYKGQQDVIKTLPALRAAGFEIEYHLIGGGDPEHLDVLACREGVRDIVHFHGPVRHADMFASLETMDIYIQPSRQEGLPRALIEAMSCGLPAIGATTGGIPELLPKDRLYRPGDIDRLADLVKELTDPSVSSAAGEINKHQVERFAASHLAARRKVVYSEFLSIHGLA